VHRLSSTHLPPLPAAVQPVTPPMPGTFSLNLCQRTQGCMKNENHTGFCAGHRGFKRKNASAGEDGAGGSNRRKSGGKGRTAASPGRATGERTCRLRLVPEPRLDDCIAATWLCPVLNSARQTPLQTSANITWLATARMQHTQQHSPLQRNVHSCLQELEWFDGRVRRMVACTWGFIMIILHRNRADHVQSMSYQLRQTFLSLCQTTRAQMCPLLCCLLSRWEASYPLLDH
jgi:hypothetical protein